MSPFELHHGRKPRTELTKIFKDNQNYRSDWTTLHVSVSPKQIPIFETQNEKIEVMNHIYILMARKIKIPFFKSLESTKKRPIKPVSENFQYPYTFFEKRKQKKLFEGKYKQKPRFALDSTEHTVRTASNENLHQKLSLEPIAFQRSPKNNLSPNKHELRRTGGESVSASESARIMEEGIFPESEQKFRKVESDEVDSEFECYGNSEKKPVHLNIENKITERNKSILALLPNRSEEDKFNANGETRDGTVLLTNAD